MSAFTEAANPSKATVPHPLEMPLRLTVLFLLLAGAALAVMAAFAPVDLLLNNEHRMATYVVDILENGGWICPRDAGGYIVNKPPAYAWLAALATLIGGGEVTRFALYFPSIASVYAIAALIWIAGRRRLGSPAAFLATLAWLLSPAAMGMMVSARYDGLFALTVLGGALLAFSAWEKERGWTWFWVVAAAGTLVKGPLCIVLAGSGLLAAAWERASGMEPRPIRGSHLRGLALFLLIVGTWLTMALWKVGYELVDTMLKGELMGHAMGLKETGESSAWHRPLGSWFGHLALWSLPATVAMLRSFFRPAPNAVERRFERFLTCVIFAGLIIFMLTPHKPSRLVIPLVPFGALLAGAEMARWTARWKPRVAHLATGAAAVLVIAGMTLNMLIEEPRRKQVRATEGMAELALWWQSIAGDFFPLTHVDTPIPFQMAMDEIRPLTTPTRAVELLQGSTAAFVAVHDLAAMEAAGLDTNAVFRLAAWPETGDPQVIILGNRKRPVWDEPIACYVDELELKLVGLRLIEGSSTEISVAPVARQCAIDIINRSGKVQEVELETVTDRRRSSFRTLQPGKAWHADVSARPRR
ncbi:MAG TPA: glycosyltransferase family 39 protein [Kiritimatiellia bacterium]|nr:glycosyltransferase family 39 protein [Kiritimatiellia bacterium]